MIGKNFREATKDTKGTRSAGGMRRDTNKWESSDNYDNFRLLFSTLKSMETASRTWKSCRGAGGPPARRMESGKQAKIAMFSVIPHLSLVVRAPGRAPFFLVCCLRPEILGTTGVKPPLPANRSRTVAFRSNDDVHRAFHFSPFTRYFPRAVYSAICESVALS